MTEETRLDAALAARGLAASRQRAQQLIREGKVRVNGAPASKCAQKVTDADTIEVDGGDFPYVSRGALKLLRALDAFECNAAGRVCVDIGASTGGFTQVLLSRGAKRVYALDVGAGQLAAPLRADARVTCMEHYNARDMRREDFPEAPELAVMDVSFISIGLILPALRRVLLPEGRLLALIKPQFEAGRRWIGKGGIVTSPRAHAEVLERLCAQAPELGWRLSAVTVSPIAGGDGNIEFLGDFAPAADGAAAPDPAAIRAFVESVHHQSDASQNYNIIYL